MNRKNLDDLKKWFVHYVSDYYTDDPDYNHAIRLKEEHTMRVCRNIVMLGTNMGLSDHDMMLAETMALFHDIGRFEQYAVYRTFIDMASENHAGLGLRQMAKHKILTGWTNNNRRLITKAIAYHNAASLPEIDDKETLFFMRLLRDADKLDIWKVVIDYYHNRDKYQNTVIELGLPDDPSYSQQVIKSFQEKRIANMQDLKTLNDFKLLQISWVFDLNFVPSFQTVKSNKYIDQIEAVLPQTKEIAEAVKQARGYVDCFL